MVKRTRTTVVVGHFEDIVSRGLRAMIEGDPSLELIASGVPPEQLPGQVRSHRPSVAIVNFGSLKGAAGVRELHRQCPDVRLLVLANRPTKSEVGQMLAFGASACLAKNSQERDILHAIHLVSRGLHVLPPAGDDQPYEASGPDLLTPRETDVLELLQAGRSNAEIAVALHVSIETVRTHARRVYRKLGVKTRRELQVRR
jgi:DNA-binding NarL/FixJ family response regulator